MVDGNNVYEYDNNDDDRDWESMGIFGDSNGDEHVDEFICMNICFSFLIDCWERVFVSWSSFNDCSTVVLDCIFSFRIYGIRLSMRMEKTNDNTEL